MNAAPRMVGIIRSIIETGNINFVRRIMAVRNFAIGIHAMGARNIRYSRTVRRFLDSFKLLRP